MSTSRAAAKMAAPVSSWLVSVMPVFFVFMMSSIDR
jgi:hypothetical protein